MVFIFLAYFTLYNGQGLSFQCMTELTTNKKKKEKKKESQEVFLDKIAFNLVFT